MMKKRLFLTGLCSFSLICLTTGCAGERSGNTVAETAALAGEADNSSAATDTDDRSSGAGEEAAEKMENTEDGGHVIEADAATEEYSNLQIEKTGDAEGDEADFYGENSAVFATNGATLTLSDLHVHTNGTHANGIFSYGEGTTVNISDSTIETEGNCSGGIMTTGGGTMNAENLTIHTSGRSSAAIRSDRGGGTVNVTGGSYSTDGTGSPAIYSTAAITVSDAVLTSTASEGIVVEGKNSVTLNNVTLNADNTQVNSDKSNTYKGVMIYQSMSGDAAEGKASFTMNGGSFTNENGDVFFVNNTVTDITLNGAVITNNGDGAFLRAEAAGWGSEGSNGGHVNLYASGQEISGDFVVDDISTLNLYLADDSSLNGAINSDGAKGNVYVEIKDGSAWTLTGDSYIGSLSCEAGSIHLNGYKLYVDGKEYTEGSSSAGQAYEIKVQSSDSDRQAPPDGDKPEGNKPEGDKPEGDKPEGMGDGTTPPEPPEGAGTPPEKPSGDMNGDMKQPPEKPSGGN